MASGWLGKGHGSLLKKSLALSSASGSRADYCFCGVLASFSGSVGLPTGPATTFSTGWTLPRTRVNKEGFSSV